MPDLLDDPTALHRHREPMHAPWYREEGHPWVLSLDGIWRFHLAPRPAAVPAGCTTPDFDDTAWHDLPVPANWELHGHGVPLYNNVAYPFPINPPYAPEDNPTGCYRRTFDLPAAWAGRRLVLEFGAVDACFRLWVNGTEVGFSTDSKLPAAFDVTAHLRPGQNHLAVVVHRWGASAYLEKQDYWHLSGIQRSVRLIAKPPVHLRDWCVQTRLTSTGAVATVRAWMHLTPGRWHEGAHTGLTGWTMAFTLRGPDGALQAETVAVPATASPMYGAESKGPLHQDAGSAVAELVVADAQPWTAETPHLSTLTIELRDPQGQVVDREVQRVGFREVAIRDGVLTLNGVRLVIRGVNRHEFHPDRGRAMTRADIREDLLAMKRLHINAIRTCHYPNTEDFYDLCDELGFYVVDEANLETHGVAALLSRDPVWAGAYLERAVRMALRDRNHPSVILWSLGNESHVGPHHAAMAAWLRDLDPTRPVQYESGFPGPAVTDLLVPMYPDLAWARQVLADPAEHRPFVMCEYAYAKGNSNGNLHEFWDLVWELPRFQGGFVWDWRDKALRLEGRLRYGTPSTEPAGTERMCLNGIVGPELEEHPGALELRHHHALLHLEAEDAAAGRLRLINRQQFQDLSGFALRWAISHDGVATATGEVPCPALPAGAAAPLTLPIPPHAPPPGVEAHLTITVVTRHPTPWAEAGQVVDVVQFALPTVANATPRRAATTPPTINGTTLQGPGWSLRVEAGAITAWEAGGRPVLSQPLLPCLSRAPTDIDLSVGTNGYAHQWRTHGLDRAVWTPETTSITRAGATAVVQVTGQLIPAGLPPVARITQAWTIHGDGTLDLTMTTEVLAPVDTVARIGLRTALPGSDRILSWFGRGPGESYPDRQQSTVVGAWQAPVRDLLTPYLFPQENGLRTDLRRLTLLDQDGHGLAVMGAPLFHASALPVPLEDLESAQHRDDLRPGETTWLHLDGHHLGLGGDTGWTRNVHPAWRQPPGTYRWSVSLQAR